MVMFRHVSLRELVRNGRTTWSLLGPNGHPLDAFAAFAESLRNSPPNTRKAYCRHLAEFFDYLIEATTLIGEGRQLTKLELTEVIEAWGDYLMLGVSSGREVARRVSLTLPPGRNAPSSVTAKKAALRRFLKLSEEVRKQMTELAKLYPGPAVADAPLLHGLGTKRELTVFERRALQTNSMLAGVVAGGPRLIEQVALGDSSRSVNYDEKRAFPYEKVLDLIDAMPTERDKAFYALLAASGCRTHEALQVLLDDDIDVEEGTVRLVDPKTRPAHPSYLALTANERDQLWWKGRTSDLTLLIEPFASRFFEALHRYLSTDHLPHGMHDFVFQYLRGTQLGRPYFLSGPATRLELFHRVCKRIGVVLPPDTGPHSLRHMYGTYALNYFPRANGDYGLPVPMVQQLLGHADVKQTLKYAKFDKDLLKLEIQNANRVLFRQGTPKRLLELKLEALNAQVTKVQAQLAFQIAANG